MPNLGSKLLQNPDLSFEELSQLLQTHQVDQQNDIPGKVNSFLSKLFTVVKLALGLTKDISSTVGYLPVQITATALSQVMDVRYSITRTRSQRISEAALMQHSRPNRDHRLHS